MLRRNCILQQFRLGQNADEIFREPIDVVFGACMRLDFLIDKSSDGLGEIAVLGFEEGKLRNQRIH